MKDYKPKAGTVAERVISWLRLQPQDYKCSTAVLAYELDLFVSHIQPSLVLAVRHGLLKMKMEDGLLYFSLGDGKPLPLPEGQYRVYEPGGTTKPTLKTKSKPLAALPTLPPLRFAVVVQMHGGLVIECEGQRLELSDVQTRFLQRLLLGLEVSACDLNSQEAV